MSSRGARWLALFSSAAAALAGGCRDAEREPPAAHESVAAPLAARQAASAPAAPTFALIDMLSACRIDQDGAFLDLGSAASQARRSYALGPFADVGGETWGGQSATTFLSGDATYDNWLLAEEPGVELRVRVKAGSARRLTASIDHHPGTLRVRSDISETLTFPKLDTPLAPGRHQVTLRWTGRRSNDARPPGYAEWIHWTRPGTASLDRRPPRRRMLVQDVVLADTPRRAIVLEAPTRLSCALRLERGARLELGLGHVGDGQGVAQIVVRSDRGATRVLAERRVNGAASGWSDLSLQLEPAGSELVQLELRTLGDGSKSRVAFSEPRLVREQKLLPTPRTKLAVLVVASGLHREILPPFPAARELEQLGKLAAASVRFSEYRVPTTVVGSVMATLLSGLPPLAHQLLSPRGRLPRGVPSLAARIHELSGESAFFTGVPQTRASFGFDTGWNRYQAFSPVHDIPATAPLDEAKLWLEQALERAPDLPRLLVVHLRGGHPPWDLSRDEAHALEPKDYAGLLEPRRGGIILDHVREQRRAAQRRLAPPDWVRLRALQLAALEKQDAALGSLIELLERAGVWEQTLFAFAGDVAAGDPPEAPFGAIRSLTDQHVVVPLWIKFPGTAALPATVKTAVSSSDVTLTLASALGLRRIEPAPALDLYQLAIGNGPVLGRPLLSLLSQSYALRWGKWLLQGTSPKPPTLCEFTVDPACAHDVLEAYPLTAEALWRATFFEHQRQRTLPLAARRPEPALLDKETTAALHVFGE